MLGELARERAHETGVVAQVPAPQPARLVGETVGPFEPGALQPRWSLRHEAGMEVERRADADQHGRVEVRAQRRHPLLLLGDADADPHDIGPRIVDLGDDRGLLLFGERAVRWRVAADDPDPGVTLAEIQCELYERSLVAAAVQVETLAGRRGSGARTSHQLWAVYAVRERMTERVERPHERLAVGHVQRGAEQRRPELGVLLRRHHGVDVAYADIAVLARGRHRVDPLERPLVVDQTKRNAQDLVGCGGRDRIR